MKNHLKTIMHYQSIIRQWLYFMKPGYQTSNYPNMIVFTESLKSYKTRITIQREF